ncbi:TfoX/Sxy family protein [Allorhizobium sp. BGMRC 0089]|uniref:TfoX/Sxy family protein n=1 Tax=Allorhizobium sonneratiae TaxID=2934936 RepID=UPI002033FF45|nr:TfoX/Sxy family protein [Allorhizobium sonneratiae]MCM2292996.1 TfoX/Sxy family protein [Allorhizobium sonneratiae]
MDRDAIEDMFQALGTISIRRMFGGKGIYHDGNIIAIELGGDMLLKADDETAALFAEAGARQWTYQRPDRAPVAMPYWSIPDSAFDDPDDMALWVRRACEAGFRAAGKPKQKKRRSPQKRQSSLDDG